MRKFTPLEAREQLLRLFADAGYEVPELEGYIQHIEETEQQLREEIRRLKLSAARRSPASPADMNSRLRDALRE